MQELQDEGYDVQTMGFGKMSTYHAQASGPLSGWQGLGAATDMPLR